jgi:hypothetical protein
VIPRAAGTGGAAFSNVKDRAAASAVNGMKESIVILTGERGSESVWGEFVDEGWLFLNLSGLRLQDLREHKHMTFCCLQKVMRIRSRGKPRYELIRIGSGPV